MDKLKNSANRIRNIIAIATFVLATNSSSPLYSMPLIKIKMVGLEDTLLVDRDGNRYPVKKMMDNNLWMTANLKVDIADSYCYENIKENCEQYGRLYTWKSAQEGCNLLGEGWRLPTNDEWQQLAKYYGFPEDSIDYRKGAYKVLLYGGSAQFNVLFGGNRAPDGQYQRLDAHGFYWTATENDNKYSLVVQFWKRRQIS